MAAASEAARRLALATAGAPPDVLPAPHHCPVGTHSRTSDGRVVCWRPRAFGLEGDRWAVDAEVADQAVPPSLARRWGSADPERVWPHWCVLEVRAKLTDVPVVRLSVRYDRVAEVLPGAGTTGGIAWRRWDVDGLVVVVGLRPCPAPGC